MKGSSFPVFLRGKLKTSGVFETLGSEGLSDRSASGLLDVTYAQLLCESMKSSGQAVPNDVAAIAAKPFLGFNFLLPRDPPDQIYSSLKPRGSPKVQRFGEGASPEVLFAKMSFNMFRFAAAVRLSNLAVLLVRSLRPTDSHGGALHHATTGVDLPRTCEYRFSGSKCCGCGPPPEVLGNHAKERFRIETNKTYGYIDRMCSRATKPEDLKICCPIWAVDCNEDDYYFEHGLERDCAPEPSECKHYECRDVSRMLQSMEDSYRNFRTEVSDTLEERLRKDSDAGVTGHGRVCSCACGELVDEEKLTCKVLNSSWYCSDVQPCCRRLTEDCAKGDPWPEEVMVKTQEATQAQELDAAEKHFASIMLGALRKLTRRCKASCDTLRKSECVKELTTVVEKVTFGKDITVQTKLEDARFQILKAYNKEHPSEATWEMTTQKVFDHFEYRLKKEREEEEHAKNAYRKTHQLVQLKKMERTTEIASQGCCACEAAVPGKRPVMGKYPTTTSFCAASDCTQYTGLSNKPACYQVPDIFCGITPEGCPSDTNSFALT
ncbi:unnamed protein product [Symbiodinium microadriaticum]|nr:unnamed protein product [Symbiodinium microadriaticum]